MVPLAIGDVSMSVQYEQGKMIEEDVNCGSTFMLNNIRAIGKAICESFHWVLPSEKIYLHMDNAGRHGTIEAIEEYTRILADEYNIDIVHQIPWSPDTNVLDLGIWCCLQWAIDGFMRGCRGDVHALNKGVHEVWSSKDLSTAFENVWNWLGRVLHLIREDNGGNKLVETKRGKQWSALDVPILGDGTVPTTDDGAIATASAAMNNSAATAGTPANPAGHFVAIDLLKDDDNDLR